MRVEAHPQRLRALLTTLAAMVGALAIAGGLPAQASEVGGQVRSVLSLSLSQPSGFSAAGPSLPRAKHGEHPYGATIDLSVTATDTPTRLSIADGEATGGRQHGHMVSGEEILSPALQASAVGGPYRSLAGKVDPQLEEWRQPLADRRATIHLRQLYAGTATRLARFHKLLLVTVTTGGP